MKASIQRGYMQKDEIAKHMTGLKKDCAKAGFLEQILRKERLLSPQTRYNCYELMAEIYRDGDPEFSNTNFNSNTRYRKSAKIFEKIGLFDKAIEVLAKHDHVIEAAELLDSRGRPAEGAKLCSDVAYQFHSQKSGLRSGMDADYRRGQELTGYIRPYAAKAIELYEKAKIFSEAVDLHKITDYRSPTGYAKLAELAAEQTTEIYRKEYYLKEAKKAYENLMDGRSAIRMSRLLSKLPIEKQHG